jgi:pimeloyl-ACP methyl ester carboxylesterase
VATEVILPRVDMDMSEGKIAFWYVKNGDLVTKGQTLFDIETDKATMEVEATASGVIDSIDGEIGVTMPVGQVVAWIRAPGEAGATADAEPSPKAAAAMPAQAPTGTAARQAPVAAPKASASPSHGNGLLRATPLARSLARERGIDLNALTGSGPRGRVIADDVPPRGTVTPASTPTRVHLHWWQRGSAAPLLLLHGFGADHASWRPLVQQLPPGQPVLGVDLPNHGKSANQSLRSFEELADAVLQRLDQEGVAACHLLGHSMGGAVALAIGAAQPQRVLSLTLLAPAGLGTEINGAFIDGLVRADSEAALKATLATLFQDPSALTPAFVSIAFQQLQAPGRQAALAAMASHLMPSGRQAEDLNAALASVQAPVKVIWGLADRIIPHAHGHGLPGQVGLHLLPAVGHLPQLEATTLVARLLMQQVRAGTEG